MSAPVNLVKDDHDPIVGSRNGKPVSLSSVLSAWKALGVDDPVMVIQNRRPVTASEIFGKRP